ncbi:hypothetical protein [Tardiphaga sp. P9-11]|jgi:hypothetical protein|uniref:hypothetical protein n=1 Tax=Tardiphaga sp. P9-11 TaxID=2024614 RepID=UPI0011F1ED52|nr:hypothetical protein [Tardiphaga sp. P9-11]KAA0072952.1 hypothetical protein CIW50_22370 [Tardiphaga sp. P9-11]
MSISLKQLTAMADIAESLAMEMRQLIALREFIASRSVENLIAAPSRRESRSRTKGIPDSTARRVACNKGRTARSPASA